MSINNFAELIQDPTFIKLAYLQSIFDDADKVFTDGPMTRSPFHMIAFLIVWSGLNGESDRENVINQLNVDAEQKALYSDTEGSYLAAEKIDNLIKTIKWKNIIAEATTTGSSDFFKLSLMLPNIEPFKLKVKEYCLSLYNAIHGTDILKESDKYNKFTISTNVVQNEIWLKPFKSEALDVWEIISYKLSDSLSEIMHANKSYKSGYFEIIPGEPYGGHHIYLNVKDLVHDDALTIEQRNIKVNEGIYRSFIGTRFSGMQVGSITRVCVSISGKAELNKEGASTEQKQDVDGVNECRMPMPTKLIVTTPVLEFCRVGIQAVFQEEAPSGSFSANNNYIQLFTESGNEVRLLDGKRNPSNAM